MSGATSTEYIFNGLFSFFVNRVNFSVVVKDLISLLPSRVLDTPTDMEQKRSASIQTSNIWVVLSIGF